MTDIPSKLLPALVDLGVKVKGARLSSVVFTPAVYKSYSHPDFAIIRQKTAAAIAQSEAPKENRQSQTEAGCDPEADLDQRHRDLRLPAARQVVRSARVGPVTRRTRRGRPRPGPGCGSRWRRPVAA